MKLEFVVGCTDQLTSAFCDIPSHSICVRYPFASVQPPCTSRTNVYLPLCCWIALLCACQLIARLGLF
ncbi:hypothetical protein C8R44DRAFT_328828 [Mycena epipterygia]|nr:hypothetical protein C8R44DRAFT_328828 [Mycena epipterygia]